MKESWQAIGSYRALVDPSCDDALLRDSLSRIKSLATGPSSVLLQAGRHRTLRVKLQSSSGTIDAVAKFFGRQSLLKDLLDRFSGSKALRTYRAAIYLKKASIGTTSPIACLERRHGGRLLESCFVSFYLEGTFCWKDILLDLWERRAPLSMFLLSVRRAATGIRRLHDAGFSHGDLGNQNLLFCGNDGAGSDDAVFIDLNRARFGRSLSLWDRSRDLDRIALPRVLLSSFIKEYWGGHVPRLFSIFWNFAFLRFRLHTVTRRLRHPAREFLYMRNPSSAPAQANYPSERDEWIFDDANDAPLRMHSDMRLLSFMGPFRAVKAILCCHRLENLVRGLRSRGAAGAGHRPARRIWVGGRIEEAEKDLMALENCPEKRALISFSEAEGEDVLKSKLQGARFLAERGVSLAAFAVQMPSFASKCGFSAMLGEILSSGIKFDWVSMGRGINSLKWGFWRKGEAEALVRLSGARLPDGAMRASPAVEAPVVQYGSFAAEGIFKGGNYAMAALYCGAEVPDPAMEAAALDAIIPESSPCGGIVLMLGSPCNIGEIAAFLPPSVKEIAAPSFLGTRERNCAL